MFEFIQITAQYSNAVLVAILPQVTEFSQKLELPVSIPITLAQVHGFNCDPHKGETGGWLQLTNGFEFWYAKGYVTGFASPDCYYRLQDLVDLKDYYGIVKMSEKEVVRLARDSLRNLGYSETTLYANGTAKVTKPPIVRSRTVPRYRVQWIEPEAGGIALDMEIDAQNKKLKSLTATNPNFSRDPPPVSAAPQPLKPGQVPDFVNEIPGLGSFYHQLNSHNRLTLEQEHTLLAAILPLVSDYARKLGLPISIPVTTNQVAAFDTQFFPGQTYLNLVGGYQFVYSHGYIQEFRAPYTFFGFKRDGRIEDYWGKWRMSETEAVELARQTIKKLGYPLEMLHLDRKPKVRKPLKIGSNHIPRYRLNWEYSLPETEDEHGGIVSATEVEVDADQKCVKSIAIFDLNLVRPPPELPGLASPRNSTPQLPPQLQFFTNAPAMPSLR